jgi:hypothetical protein
MLAVVVARKYIIEPESGRSSPAGREEKANFARVSYCDTLAGKPLTLISHHDILRPLGTLTGWPTVSGHEV